MQTIAPSSKISSKKRIALQVILLCLATFASVTLAILWFPKLWAVREAILASCAEEELLTSKAQDHLDELVEMQSNRSAFQEKIHVVSSHDEEARQVLPDSCIEPPIEKILKDLASKTSIKSVKLENLAHDFQQSATVLRVGFEVVGSIEDLEKFFKDMSSSKRLVTVKQVTFEPELDWQMGRISYYARGQLRLAAKR